jgi:hypothetical protein
MGILLEIIFSLLFEVVFALLAGAAEYAFYKRQKRFWMWAFGIVGIGVMIWWRGPQLWTTYAVALGWLACLVFLDRRLMAKPDREPPESPTTAP